MSNRVLLVDDDSGDRLLMRRALGACGGDVEVVCASNGIEAVKILRSGPLPQIVLLDLKMPVMDGRELLGKVKSTEQWSAIPTIVVSTSNDAVDVTDCYELRANAYVVKPDSVAGYRELGASLIGFWFSRATLPH